MIDGTAFLEITAEQFEHCQINEAVNNLAEIFTVNGVSTLGGRVAGDFISGNFGDWVDMFLEGKNKGSKVLQYEGIGKIVSALLNYENR
mmetsp:Transcript_18329/g.16205  ORF Transcript_18329/g.16205 Transcript_18329/m.16205 type:complete len:89 (+) Transcript_18329:422-688(+)